LASSSFLPSGTTEEAAHERKASENPFCDEATFILAIDSHAPVHTPSPQVYENFLGRELQANYQP
jgi:hypothetical protein